MTPCDGVPSELAEITNLQKVECLDDPCVYFLVCGGRVVYVGQTVNLRTRVSDHADKVFDSVFFIRCSSDEMNTLEHHWITKLKPELNIKFAEQKSRRDRKGAIRFDTMIEAKRQLSRERGIGKNGPSAEQIIERMVVILAKRIEMTSPSSV